MGAVAVVTAIGASGESDDETALASSAISVTATVRTTPAPTPSRAPATTPPAGRTTTSTTMPARSGAPEPASSATEAGCEEPDPSIVSAIEASLNPGLDLMNIAAVSTLIDGIEYIYTSGDVYEDGERSSSSVVWITPGFGVMGLSGNSRDVSNLPFGRGVLDVSAGDEYGSQVQNCVIALSRGR